jgi:hypothetical protein
MKWHRLQPGYLESEHGYSDNDPNQPHSSSNFWTPSQRKDANITDVDADSIRPSVTRSSSTSVDKGVRGRLRLEETATARAEKVRLRFKKISPVPLFKAPLTKSPSPIIWRGQWEIVVHTRLISFVLAWLIDPGKITADRMRFS